MSILLSIWQHNLLLRRYRLIARHWYLIEEKFRFEFTAMYIRLYFAIDFNLHAFTSFNVSACLISKFHFWLIRALTHWRYWPITTSMTSTVNKYHIQIYINVATLWNYDNCYMVGQNEHYIIFLPVCELKRGVGISFTTVHWVVFYC